jgi:hypothetical protein
MAAHPHTSPIALSNHRELVAKRPKKRSPNLTKRLMMAIDLLVWGHDDVDVMTLDKAAELAKISVRSLRLSSVKPHVQKYHREQMMALRNGERGNNLRTAIQIRDDAKLKETVSGQRTRLQAAAMLDQDLYTNVPAAQAAAHNITVNVVSPGYVIDMREDVQQVAKPVHQIDHLGQNQTIPLISHEDVPTE